MKHVRPALVAMLAPTLAGLLSIVGCSSKEEKDNHAGDVGQHENKNEHKEAKGSSQGRGGSKPTEAVASKGWGTIKGVVTYNGEPPAAADLPIDKDKNVCESAEAKERGDTKVQNWKIGGANHGVANVVVWLREPQGKYFKIPDDLKKVKQPVKIDQPFCAFEPHVIVLYPSYYDEETKGQTDTGQELKVKNSAAIAHNTKTEASDPVLNPGANFQLPAKGESNEPIVFKPCKEKNAGGEQQIDIACNIHSWMRAYARVFDHPFVGKTSGDSKEDKDFGAYTIAKAPAGVELELVYWHESMPEPKVLKSVTVDDGKTTTVDFKVPE